MVIFYRKVRKENAKVAKKNALISDCCVLYEKTLRPLRLIFLIFITIPAIQKEKGKTRPANPFSNQ